MLKVKIDSTSKTSARVFSTQRLLLALLQHLWRYEKARYHQLYGCHGHPRSGAKIQGSITVDKAGGDLERTMFIDALREKRVQTAFMNIGLSSHIISTCDHTSKVN